MDPHAEVKVLAPKRRKCGPIMSKTRSADEAAAHGIKMRAAEGVEVRPDFVVCCASVTNALLCRLRMRTRSRRGRRRCVRTLWSALQA
jgi:hypothetical protein